ncbi:RsmB/NOP family class I SAM-dependent RNA methyltransferase [Paenibacillus glycanilyticus]|uniref:RsmB/NOP family class I SAM-dependent RNA methyltransferase n=1 Tax=Paenibacillus glycanilyticus TaxID=126569 RepID=UPI00203BF04E|nr:RsmB/NOP family class I SAM-dependent RNA methyltransferase [Paenibacillus glycanilyticus]MCM3627209.1 RsmB/NOP family class I SAM-dependent RNA methyltransferase [Paenibacillus glycanilyticus]
MSGYLPIAFTTKMKSLLGEEFDRFMSSYEDPRVYGIRINRLKLDAKEWKDISPMGESVRPIPWAPDGFYYEEGARPGKHPHYHAGLYYIQEPSAMAPVELLDVRPGHRVLDLCAAPGGKSTQIAAKLQGSGVLVSNDNARERTKALAKNIELAGVRNAVVLNEEPSALAPVFRGWFDRILVDAPCSGEGMFRKDESMIAEWEKHSIERCSVMQRHILRDAAAMLAPGGLLVYSTCTFSPEENEAQIAELLAEYSDFEVLPVDHRYGWKQGQPQWAGEAGQELTAEQLTSLEGTVRLWPHHIEGEGHYAAVLSRKGSAAVEASPADSNDAVQADEENVKRKKVKGNAGAALRAAEKRSSREGKDNGRLNRAAADSSRRSGRGQAESVDPAGLWHAFAERELSAAFAGLGSVHCFGSRVYLQPDGLPSLDGLRVVRAGWYVGEAGRNKFEPSQALAMGLRQLEAARSLDFRSDDPNVIRYLKGETLFVEPAQITVHQEAVKTPQPLKGFVLVCTDGYPIGWGKYSGDGMLKNELPAGWRWM